MELSAIMLQLEVREKELMKYVHKPFIRAVISLILFTVTNISNYLDDRAKGCMFSYSEKNKMISFCFVHFVYFRTVQHFDSHPDGFSDIVTHF